MNYEHLVLAIDEESNNVWSDQEVEGLEIFEKKYSEEYKELHVRYREQQ